VIPIHELGPTLPAVLEALTSAGVPMHVIAVRDGKIERWYANHHAAAMLGYTIDEVMNIPVEEIVLPEQRHLLHQLAAGFRAGQAVPPVIELTSIHKDGSPIQLEYALGSVRVGDVDVYALSPRPVVATVQTQISLLEADRIELVGALAAGFAHEINNPLTSVLLNLRSLRKQLTAEPNSTAAQVLRCLDDVTLGAERIANNVRALQTLATRSATQSIDLAAIVSSALRLAAPTLEPRAQVIRQILPVRAVIGEESRIGQAVLAMLLFSSSGFEAESTSSTNRIVVIVEERQPHIVVEVSDNGRDLTAEEIRGAFNPFFRSPARGAGVGVGLGVARSVATGLGGEVTLAPRAGGGAVITMRLPAAA
jgi:two-component system NtrC family sensor kinase